MSGERFTFFVILGAMRTGSNFLERSLAQHPQIASHGELFNPDFFGRKGVESAFGMALAEREEDPLLLLDYIRQDANKLPGFRLFEGHDTRVMDAVLSDPSVAKIILHRDPLDSFLSLRIAQETDQWILGNARSRKTARVTFVSQEFEAYRARQVAFYSDLARRLQQSGQAAFHLNFSQLGDVDVLNGALRFLGLSGGLKAPDGSLKPQNPGSHSEKVSNPDDLLPYIGEVAEIRTPRAPQLKRMITSDSRGCLFAPVAGVPEEPLRHWLGESTAEHSQKTLKLWQEANPGFTSISCVMHPALRAYWVFCQRIVAEGPGSFAKIRRRLVRFHDLELPVAQDPASWQRGYVQFLTFLRANIAGQTGIRIDDEWALQVDLIAAINAQQPVFNILKDSEITEWTRGAVVIGERPHDDAPAFSDIYSGEIEGLTRKIYRQDYRRFGFGNWVSGSL